MVATRDPHSPRRSADRTGSGCATAGRRRRAPGTGLGRGLVGGGLLCLAPLGRVDDLLIVKGVKTQGCGDPILSRVFTISQTPPEYAIQVFQALPDPNACPDTYVAVVFEIAVKTPVQQETAGVFTVDGKMIAYSPGDETPMRVFHSIESVDALLMESFPVQIMLQVKGYQTDGCDAPVQIQQSREGNTVSVQIFRDLPPDMVCTLAYTPYKATVKLDGGFESGTYAIDVSGMVITVKI